MSKSFYKPRTKVRGLFEHERIAVAFRNSLCRKFHETREIFLHPKVPNKPRLLSRGLRKDFLMKKGQVWLETVLYTMIGLALIGITLAIVVPKITETRERIMIEQTIDSLNEFDGKINDAMKLAGNVRIVEFKIKQGELYINSTEDEIVFVIRGLKKVYSEPGAVIDIGKVNVFSIEGKGDNSVRMVMDYNGTANLTYKNNDENKKFSPASVPYKFSIKNKGLTDGLWAMDIEEI